MTVANAFIGSILCENKTIGYMDPSLNKIFEERVVNSSSLFQRYAMTRVITFPILGMVLAFIFGGIRPIVNATQIWFLDFLAKQVHN